MAAGEPAWCVHVGDWGADNFELFCATRESVTHDPIRVCVGRVYLGQLAWWSRPRRCRGGREFTPADPAGAMGERPSRVRSWHRVLGRPARRLQLSVLVKASGPTGRRGSRCPRASGGPRSRRQLPPAAGDPAHGRKRPGTAAVPAAK